MSTRNAGRYIGPVNYVKSRFQKKWTRNWIWIGILSSKIVRMMLTLHGKCFAKIQRSWAGNVFLGKFVKTSRKRFSIPLDRKTLADRKEKCRLWKRYPNTKDAEIYEEYCECRNQLRRLTRMNIAKKAKTNGISWAVKRNWSHPHRICSYLHRLIQI